jgi:hypothetical protein
MTHFSCQNLQTQNTGCHISWKLLQFHAFGLIILNTLTTVMASGINLASKHIHLKNNKMLQTNNIPEAIIT